MISRWNQTGGMFHKKKKLSTTSILAILGSKSATGTVVIYIEDVNDNAPEIQPKDLTLCQTDGMQTFVRVEAEDKDLSPFSGPFTFELADGHDGRWTITGFNGKT